MSDVFSERRSGVVCFSEKKASNSPHPATETKRDEPVLTSNPPQTTQRRPQTAIQPQPTHQHSTMFFSKKFHFLSFSLVSDRIFTTTARSQKTQNIRSGAVWFGGSRWSA